MSNDLEWHRAASVQDVPEGRVASVTCAHRTFCLTHHAGTFAALDNKCPHQGGPLGEGSIENGWLRCPWHGWDFHPTTGASPDGHDDGVESFPVEVRPDGVYIGLPKEPDPDRSSSDVVAETLVNWGVKWVFGMVGHSNLGLADAIRRRTVQGEMGYVAIRHEGAASFACSAYGKLTGRPAACLAIAGPGATNLLTGLWDAHVDHAPVIALAGQVQSQWFGRDAFQELDLKAAFGGVARWSAVMLKDADYAELATLACKHAILEEGPVQLVFPDEVQTLPSDAPAGGPTGRLVNRRVAPDPEACAEATAAVAASRKPVIVVGHGARFHMDAIVTFAERLSCPVVTTFKAKGQIGDHHPLAAGVLGRSGTPVASWFLNESDLLIVLGASFSNHTGIPAKARTLQIDRDPLALGNRHPIDHLLQADIGLGLAAIDTALPEEVDTVDRRSELAERWSLWRAEKRKRESEDRGQGIHSATLFAALSDAVDDDAIIAVDVGNNTYSFGRYFETKHQAVLMSGYLGSIGFGLPAAMGAWAATQEVGTPFSGRQVVSVSGDGGLGQYLAELTTLALHGMNITHVVLHNGELGKISKEQRAGEFDVWQTTLVNPSFAAFAEQCGLLGIRVERPGDLARALRTALDHDGPALVEVMTDAALI
ncbi:MAG: pyruvate oxidase [Myxococcota bacterium]|jgi:pyruvate oxidase